MRSNRIGGALFFAVVSVLAVGCAGAAPQAASSASATPVATSPAAESGAAAPNAAPSVASTPMPATPAGGIEAPAATFNASAATLDASMSDCRQACRALASMDRACGAICKNDVDDRCKDDSARLKSARDRVRAACVTCPDGTPVDRDAPIPSSSPATP